MFGGSVEAGKAFVKFFLEDKDFKKKLSSISESLTKFGKVGVMATAPLIAGFAAALTAGTSLADTLDDTAKRIGISTEAVATLGYAANQSATDIGTLEKGIGVMQKKITAAAAGNEKLIGTFQKLGVNVQQLASMSPDQQFLTLADAISKVPDPTQRAALAMQVFGGAGRQLLPLLVAGERGIVDLQQAAIDLGLSLSTDQVAQLTTFADTVGTVKDQLMFLAANIAAAVAGPLTDLLTSQQANIAAAIEWVGRNGELILKVGEVTAVVGGLSIALIGIGKVVGSITVIVGGLRTAIVGLGVAMQIISRHPIIAALSAIAAGALLVMEYFGGATDASEDFAKGLDNVQLKAPTPSPAVAAQAQQLQATMGAGVAPIAGVPAEAFNAAAHSIAVSNLGKTERLLEKIEKVASDQLLFFRGQRGGLLVGAG